MEVDLTAELALCSDCLESRLLQGRHVTGLKAAAFLTCSIKVFHWFQHGRGLVREVK